MAGNEQFHRKAIEAASAGVEVAIARMRATGEGATGTFGPADLGDTTPSSYTGTTRYMGREASLPGSSAEKFFGEHYEIESTGVSSRGARELQVQGAMVISSTAGVRTFHRLGDGLATGGAP
jgi:hypothetical protein